MAPTSEEQEGQEELREQGKRPEARPGEQTAPQPREQAPGQEQAQGRARNQTRAPRPGAASGERERPAKRQLSGEDAAARLATQVVERTLKDAELTWESPEPGTYVVTLPGTKKLSTTCSLVIGRHTLSLNAFVVRRPDENHEAVYRWLLERNTRLYGVGYAIDRLGDVFLVGKLPLAAVTAEELDRLLGTVLENADGSFNTLLEMGFASSIRKEWQWRVKRGESLRNLEAFAHLADPDRRRGPADAQTTVTAPGTSVAPDAGTSFDAGTGEPPVTSRPPTGRDAQDSANRPG